LLLQRARLSHAVLHAALVVLLVAIAVTAAQWPAFHELVVQEDGPVEWLSVGFFLAAFVLRARSAWRDRSVLDALVALFCLFVAGEEVSWGQRLLGYDAAEVFLEHNRQQETTLHNFAAIFGQPKWSLAAALFAFGVAAPLLARSRRGKAIGERIRLTPPAVGMVPGFTILVLLLAWYPVRFTGEWVEMIAGFLFLASSPISGVAVGGVVALAGAALMTVATSARSTAAGDRRLVCARAEVPALLEDVLGGAATVRVLEVSSLEKRFWTAVGEGYLILDSLSAFRTVPCAESSAQRREFLIDPWGLAYWLDIQDASGASEVMVYSFGPDRRRGGGDDIRASATVEYAQLTN
jgi:hypothetical protein